MPSRSEVDTPIGSDVCVCGDYRSEHGWGENAACRVCGGMAGPYNGCAAFRFSRCATEEEVAHWNLYHAKKAGRRGKTMTQFLWAVEEFTDGEWRLLPNTVHVRRYHAAFDMKMLRESYPDKYRIVKYERLEKPR